MACDDRQLTQAQREAAFAQQRTGVVRAVRPFSGSPTIENLIDYVNRELGPAVRDSRQAVNDVYLQVADNAPSANPLAFYFSTDTTNADPTTGRIRLNASPQNTATVMRVSQTNGRLIDVLPWLDVMAGGPTIPLGVVTLVDAINPARFIRWDLNTMTDMGLYWDLGITIIESSDTDPFVEDEAVVVGFISGVSAAGSTIPVGALTPIPADTFVGNITTGIAPPAAVPLANIDSTSIIYDATTHTMQRAALTGFAVAAQNVNATTSAEPIVTYTASANMSAERVATSSTSVAVSIATASQIDWQRAALTGDVTAPANSNATTIADDAVTNAKLANMAQATIKLRASGTGTGDPIDGTVTQALDMAGSTRGSLLERGASTWGVITPGTTGFALVSQGAGADPIYAKITSTGSSLGWDDVLVNDATSGANNPRVNTGQFFEFGAPFGGPVLTGNIRAYDTPFTVDATNALVLSGQNSVQLIAPVTGDSILISGSGVLLNGSSAGDFVDVWSSGGLRVASGLTGTSPGAIRIVEDDAMALTDVAGEGKFWVRDDAPNIPMFTGDTGVDGTLQNAFAEQLTAATVTNATTVLACTQTFTIPANTLRVGSRFRVEYTYQFSRGATATALDLTSFFDFNLGVVAISTVTTSTVTSGHVRQARVVGEFTVLTTGAGGTVMATMSIWTQCFTGGVFQYADAVNLAAAFDTTTARSVRGAVQMSAGVASTTITATGGHVEWLR